MTESLVLTHAEVEFLLRSRPPEHVAVRELLDLAPEDESSEAALAGLASLLERGLCRNEGDRVTPAPELMLVLTGLSQARVGTRALGWAASTRVLVHIFSGPRVSLAFFPAADGQFTVGQLDPSVPIVEQITRFVDSCLAGDSRSSVVIQSVTRADRVGIAVATDEHGAWFVSDSEDAPHRPTPSTRAQAIKRIHKLLPSTPRS